MSKKEIRGIEVFHHWLMRKFDRTVSRSVWLQFVWLAGITLLVFALLFFVSWAFNPKIGGETYSLRFLNLLNHYMNPGSFNRPGDGNSNFLVFLTSIAGMIFLWGMLIVVFSNMLERRVNKIQNGRVYYRFTNHIVIIGYDNMTIGLIRQLWEKYNGVEIVMLTIQRVPGVRRELLSHLGEDIEKKIIILSGNRTLEEDLKKLHLHNCREIFLLGENEEYDHDSLNIDCLKKIAYILEEKNMATRIRCTVLFEYQSTFAIFQQLDLDEIKSCIEFVPFNFYETWAQKIFVDGKYQSPDKRDDDICYEYLDGSGITKDSPCTVHLVIAGMSRMGVALGVQASHLCHFPNFVANRTKKTRITFIDENADREMNFLKGRYLHLFNEITHSYEDIENPSNNKTWDSEGNFTDIEWHFIKGQIEHPDIQSKISFWCCQENVFLTIAVCFEHPPVAIAAGLYMPYEVYERNIPVLIRQETSHSILSMLKTSPRYKNVKAFGMLNNCYDLEKADDPMPMMVNYVYKEGIPEKFTDDIKTLWHPLIISHKWSNKYNSDSIRFKIRSFNIRPDDRFDKEQIELMAKVEHNRWNIEKLLMGFRATNQAEKEEIARSPEIHAELKSRFIHHCIGNYDDLKDGFREYDRRISEALPMIIREARIYDWFL